MRGCTLPSNNQKSFHPSFLIFCQHLGILIHWDRRTNIRLDSTPPVLHYLVQLPNPVLIPHNKLTTSQSPSPRLGQLPPNFELDLHTKSPSIFTCAFKRRLQGRSSNISTQTISQAASAPSSSSGGKKGLSVPPPTTDLRRAFFLATKLPKTAL
jgi:hypothetical protein